MLFFGSFLGLAVPQVSRTFYLVNTNENRCDPFYYGIKAKGRQVVGMNGTYELREPAAPYSGNFDGENSPLSVENTYFWDNML
jgi:hypothetical protein